MKSQSYIPSWTLICLTVAAAGYTLWSRVPKSKKETPQDNEDDAPEQIASFNVPQQIDISEHKSADLTRIQTQNTITIAYASTTGTCKSFATTLHETLKSLVGNSTTSKVNLQICTVDELDWWDELLNKENENEANNSSSVEKFPPVVIFVLPTWTGGTLPEQYAALLTSLHEICHDWRVAPKPLRSGDANDGVATKRGSHKNDLETLQIASFGMGSTAYDKTTFCKPAKDVFKYFMKLGARSLLVSHGKSVVGMGDDDAGDCKAEFKDWMNRVVKRLEEMHVVSPASKSLQKNSECCKNSESDNGESCACQEEKTNMDDDDAGCCSNEVDDDSEGFYSDDDDDDYSDDDGDDDDEEKKEPDVMDLEDLGSAMKPESTKRKVVKEMVTSKQAVALKKEGYRIVGTHSAVKLCRWTKHQLRGRGGCYKHTFYGITSYQCMEATPSLACANKCVFCWRHHKNPVGREWRWKMDDPYFIVDEAVKEHVKMIKEAKGIPGVKKDRWQEAHTVRHCALSLVGEPIMYPRINEFLGELHNRWISTYLVTNGQHPAAIETLRPITQLYVSVDAPTPETLEEIDRPLFKDAWERLRASLKLLKSKGQRTVARLTIVKGWNSDEISGYAKLIALGHCSFIEVKGVTFCGKSDASNLNMTNTPWHHEVVDMCKKLKIELQKIRDACKNDDEKIPEYDIACEHKHSVSVLLARVDQFAEDDPVTKTRKWKTWIDYDKFQRLAAKNAEDPSFTFTVQDYAEETPAWALFGAEEEGFDPTDSRHRRKQKYPKYTKFDDDGIPTHDTDGAIISEDERKRLRKLMEDKKREIGDGVSVLDVRGEKVIDDASLMFRGLVITK